MAITQAEAEAYLVKALEKFAAAIRPKITAPINGNEFGAFLSLAYNIGPGAFAKSSALRKFNAGDKAGAADAILLWNKAGGRVMKGLDRRRAAERKLFLTPDAKPLAPNPVADSRAPDPAAKPDAPAMLPDGSGKWVIGIGGIAAVVIAAGDRLAEWWAALLNMF
jgi:GH24 family phage-related lysozyme (muramidase)